MNIFVHFFLNMLLFYPFKRNNTELMIVGLSGILIDIDHVIHILFKEKLLSPKKIIKWSKRELKLHRPHMFIFHTIEPIIIFIILASFIHYYLFLVAIGFLLHWLSDAVQYIFIYKSYKPWMQYFSLTYYLMSKPKPYY